MKKKIANTGNYVKRIQENIKNGWKYPKILIYATTPGGKWGNINHYYFIDVDTLAHICDIPTWASANGKYSSDLSRIEFYKKKYGVTSLQKAISLRE